MQKSQVYGVIWACNKAFALFRPVSPCFARFAHRVSPSALYKNHSPCTLAAAARGGERLIWRGSGGAEGGGLERMDGGPVAHSLLE